MLFRLIILKKRLLIISSFVFLVSAFPGVSSNINVTFADGEKVHGKSIRLIKGRNATEIIQAKNSNGDVMANAKITVTVKDPAIASIKLKDVGSEDQVDDRGKIVAAMTDDTGSKAFIVKGLRGGKTTINFMITDDGTDLVKRTLTVKVIELKIKDNTSW